MNSLFTLVSLKDLELQSLLVTKQRFPTKIKRDFISLQNPMKLSMRQPLGK